MGPIKKLQAFVCAQTFWPQFMVRWFQAEKGPFTIFFYCPLAKCGISVANIYDIIKKPVDTINPVQQTVIAMSGTLFARLDVICKIDGAGFSSLDSLCLYLQTQQWHQQGSFSCGENCKYFERLVLVNQGNQCEIQNIITYRQDCQAPVLILDRILERILFLDSNSLKINYFFEQNNIEYSDILIYLLKLDLFLESFQSRRNLE